MVDLASIFERAKISGGKRHRFAEAIEIDKAHVLDYSSTVKNNVSTSVDCYVSGHYVDRQGNMLEVKQRYTIYVRYGQDTFNQALASIRQQILNDFQKKYPGLTLDEVFVPNLIIPKGDEGLTEDELFYYGSKEFKKMSSLQQRDFQLKSAGDMYKRNVGTIKKRYSL